MHSNKLVSGAFNLQDADRGQKAATGESLESIRRTPGAGLVADAHRALGRMVARIAVAVAIVAVGLLTASGAQAQSRGYIPTPSGVQVVDVATQAVIANIPGLTNGLGGSFNAAGTRIYFATTANTVVAIDTATNTVLPPVAVGATPNITLVSPDDSRVYVVNTASSTISVINTATNLVSATIPIPATPITSITVSSDGARLYVTGFNTNATYVVDTATNTIIHTIPTLANPEMSFLNSAGTQLYVVGANTQTVQVINLADDSIAATIPTPATGLTTRYLIRNQAGTRAYVAGDTGDITVLDLTNNTVLTTVNPGGTGVGLTLDPTGAFLYTAVSGSSALRVLDTATNLFLPNVPLAADGVSFGNLFNNLPAPPVPAGPQSIPTLSEYAVLSLSLLLGLVAWRRTRVSRGQ